VRERRKIGKYVSAASRQPSMMIGLRPTRSESQPNTTKNGVPSSRETATRMFAVCASTLSVCVRKNSV
jgi:hypothetical protein